MDYEKTLKEIEEFILYKAGYLLDEATEHRFIKYLEKQKEPKPGTTEDNPIDPFDTKLFQDGVKEGRRLEREDMQKEPFSCGHENGNNDLQKL